MEHWVEEMEGWDDRPFSGGYAGLRDLAAADFSGAVSTGGTWLFMVSGRVVAVVEHRQTNTGTVVTDADVERFEGADGTASAAPHPSVPLLVAMKTRDGETRGKYYTEKTPVDEVAATLEEGGFTGYVELSENVLSGDYYTLYQGGRATDLAFIGNARRLLTGDDAHERMADEVGIYEVVAVDLDVVDVPGAGSDAAGDAAGSADAAGSGAAGAAGGRAAGAAGDGSGITGTEAPDTTTTREETAGEAGDPVDPAGEDSIVGEPQDEEPPTGGSPEEAGDVRTGTEGAGEGGTAENGTTGGRPSDDPSGDHPSGGGSSATESAADATASAGAGGAGGDARSGDEAASVTERIDALTVPSVDPERTGTGGVEGERADAAEPGEELVPHAVEDTDAEDGADTGDGADAATDEAGVAVLREEVRVTREELADTKRERDDLAARVEELESRLDERDQGGSTGGETGGPSLGADDAAAGTNLFVRYGSKGKLTLDDAHRGDGAADELRANLRLEHHTTFEDEGATVDGRPFRAWLEGTQRFRFVDWLVTTLPFEIRETGAVEGLRDLYDALPALDRVEFDGTVTVDGDEGDGERSFGLVGRDKMGDPLLVADLETTREPVGESAMADLVTDASATAGGHDTLAGAFYVTAAFYEPAALETAREATSGSMLSRDRRRSFVKLSRSRGYHLALVEARDASFHLSVPDL